MGLEALITLRIVSLRTTSGRMSGRQVEECLAVNNDSIRALKKILAIDVLQETYVQSII